MAHAPLRSVADPARRALTLSVADMLAEAMADVTERTARQLSAMAKVLAAGVAPERVQHANEKVGVEAQKSVLRSYNQVVTARRKQPSLPAYRLQSRFAGGALRRALDGPEFFLATAQGLAFGNVKELNREARHWARLNYGAGSVGKGSRRQFQVKWSDLVVGVISLDKPARPAFKAPTGYFVHGASGESQRFDEGRRGMDQFRPRGSAMHPTRGIVARNFLDAGLKTIADEFPNRYQDLYRELFKAGLAPLGSPQPRKVISHTKTYQRYRLRPPSG